LADIVTLTLNPALDISTSTDAVRPTDKLRCGPPRYDPGGGGVNVARVVKVLEGDAFAIFPAGGPTGANLSGLLDRDGIPHRAIPIAGMTRESFSVMETGTGLQYRFVLPGPALSAREEAECLETLAKAAQGAGFIVASGSLPPGMPSDFYQRVADLSRGLGARFVLDTSGKALSDIRSGVFLLKPSVRELSDLVGRNLPGPDDRIAAARELIDRGRSEIVVVSLGAEGAILVTSDRSEAFPAIPVEPQSAVGAGDSMVAAMVLGLHRGMMLHDAVRFGMAAGAATLMTPGTELCRREDVERLFART
jgi:6-phosphofructokinase 2